MPIFAAAVWQFWARPHRAFFAPAERRTGRKCLPYNGPMGVHPNRCMPDTEDTHGDSDLQDQRLQDYHSALGETKTTIARLPGFRTRSGYEFSSIDLAYLTLGTLSEKRDNVILVCHALSGNAHVAGIDEASGKPGWWDYHVGPGKTIDTDRFFVICTNVIGGCHGSTGPGSIDPGTGRPYGMSFPPVTIRDMVAAQVLLMESLGIETLFAVIGGSMGGMQALVWAIEHPGRVRYCIPIASCMAHSAMQIAFNEVGRQAIITDPNWNGGNYTEDNSPEHGLAVARMVAHVTYLSEYSMRKKFGRRLQRAAAPEDLFPVYFSIESYLQHQGESFVRRFDPNSYLYITKALDMFDLLDGRPSNEVFQKTDTHFLVVSFESDWLYPPDQSRELVRALKRSNRVVSYLNLETPYGHDSFLIKNPEFERSVGNYLSQKYRRLLEEYVHSDDGVESGPSIRSAAGA
ncbi:MAG: homoserine O-acetyltransferase [Leptospiraceae bacterium]|nr:homoserine O-acetyltransferase [Leptospiraceae bacterium]